jgi:hypothetical protein
MTQPICGVDSSEGRHTEKAPVQATPNAADDQALSRSRRTLSRSSSVLASSLRLSTRVRGEGFLKLKHALLRSLRIPQSERHAKENEFVRYSG